MAAGLPLTFLLDPDGEAPNNPRLPLLVYRDVLPVAAAEDPAAWFERTFEANGWSGGWRNGIHSFLHFHTGTHEVLGVASGSATVEFGGARGQVLTVDSGDVVVLPAGTGHRRLAATADLLVVGAYPANGRFDQKRPGDLSLEAARRAVAAVPLPVADPVRGPTGPLLSLWGDGAR